MQVLELPVVTAVLAQFPMPQAAKLLGVPFLLFGKAATC